MAKKTKSDALEGDKKPERKAAYAGIPAAEQRAYVEKVIRKQCGLDDEAASKRAGELSPEDFATLHDAGRDGQVGVVRELLGLE